MGHDFGLQTASGHFRVDEESKEPYAADVLARLHADAAVVIARYPRARSALLPLLHLVQSVDGYVTGRGIDFCAEVLDLTTAEVSGVATFYTQYKRHPNGRYTVGVCINTLCAVMGGDEIWERVSDHLGIGHDETTEDGAVTLERIECNAACDYAPVVMANWEFFDNQTPESTVQLVDDLRAGNDVTPTRGARTVRTFPEVSRVLAGFPDGLADEGVGAGEASLRGLRLAKEHGWTAPPGPSAADEQPTASHPVDDASSGPGPAPHSEGGSSAYGSVNTPTNSAAEKPGGVPAQKSEADKHASDATSPKEEGP
jgi:NADH-quinone oxidoreductase subunit E